MKTGRTALWLMGAALPCALIAQNPPSPAQLIRKAIAANKAQDDKGSKYTYREDHIESQVDKNGKAGPPTSKTYEHIMLEGDDYKKPILIDGKPLDAKTRKKADEGLEKTRSERRKRGILSFHRTVSLGGLDLPERLFDNQVTGEETVLGRKTWRMESEPKPGYKPANQQEEQTLASRRTSWFDQQDDVMIRESNAYIRAANSFQPGSTIDLELGKIGEEWPIDNVTVRMDMKIVPGVHARVESHQRYYDYKRFTVDSTITTE